MGSVGGDFDSVSDGRGSPVATRQHSSPKSAHDGPSTPSKLQRRPSASRSVKSTTERSRQVAQNGLRTPAVPPLPGADDFDAAPAPNVGYNKKDDTPKEKQGFFRRVFGSSKSNSTTNLVSDLPPVLRHPINDRPYTQSRLQQQASSTTLSTPTRETTSAHSNHPALQKKSSFFRRRKKSNADEAPPLPDDVPPVPSLQQVDPAKLVERSAPVSPASSLRKVMNPYLHKHSMSGGRETGIPYSATAPLADITNSALDRDDDRREFQRDFSPDYEPSPKAKIRAVSGNEGSERDVFYDAPQKQSSPLVGDGTFLNLSDHDDSVRSAKGRGADDTIRAGKRSEEASRQATSPHTPSSDVRKGSVPSVRVEGAESPDDKVLGTLKYMQTKGLDEPNFVVGDPTEDERQKAQSIYDGEEDFIGKDKAAAWMGEEGPVRKRTLQAYMELYDFKDQNILTSIRSICARLVLKGETQQVDRILAAFSNRWCQCNPNHGFKAIGKYSPSADSDVLWLTGLDVIHTICYSIMLLNTDLHLADIEQKMTRSQFVKNTLGTIRQAVADSKPDAFQRASILPEKGGLGVGSGPATASAEDKASFRQSFRPAPRDDDQGPLIKAPFYGTARAWEEQVETILKNTYSSIREDRLPLFGSNAENVGFGASQSNLSIVTGKLKRSPSVLSRAPSEGGISARGRVPDGKNAGSRWTSKSRSRPGLGRNGMGSSRTSFDDENSIWSPSMSSATWSRYSLGRTQGSMSQDSFASAMPRGQYQQSIGFATALSQAMFRDEDANGNETAPSIMSSDMPHDQLLEDESLALAGAPWVKEGMVIHKHHLDVRGKRAKERSWTEVFGVIQKGQMSLFSFSKSQRQKPRPRTAGSVAVGGGNWQDNAVNVGTFNLRLTLASALPSPGYSRTRPYVWALSLPTGAVHLFQVGTPEIIKEFVNTANYWSARLSTHPLVGGISNIEYGWSDAIVNNALVAAINESTDPSGKTSRPASGSTHQRKSSAASGSFRGSSFDQVAGAFTNSTSRNKLPGDRVNIAPWTAPTMSMRPSNLSEADQLTALTTYVKSIEDDLQAHNVLRSPMLLAFTPRGQNAGKAMANWERKSSYLLREIVKFRTYVDCLQNADTRKAEIYKERDLAQRAARGEVSDHEMEVSSGDEADETLRPE